MLSVFVEMMETEQRTLYVVSVCGMMGKEQRTLQVVIVCGNDGNGEHCMLSLFIGMMETENIVYYHRLWK